MHFAVCLFEFSILGTSANTTHFQAYLLEGLSRWNEDRAAQAVDSSAPEFRCYDQELTYAVNRLSEQVYGKEDDTSFQLPGKFTGNVLTFSFKAKVSINIILREFFK